MAVREKDWIVAKSGRPPRREDQDPVHPALESLICAIWPGERQDADESRPPRRRRPARLELALDAAHRGVKVLRGTRPARRVNARRPVKRLDAKPRIVGERNEPRSLRGGARLQDGIVVETRPGLLRLLKTKLGS